jgi:urea transport system permease protein
VLGAIVVNWMRVNVSSARPDDWQYLQGLLFIVVLAFAPGGIAGMLRTGIRRLRGLAAGRNPAVADLEVEVAA